MDIKGVKEMNKEQIKQQIEDLKANLKSLEVKGE